MMSNRATPSQIRQAATRSSPDELAQILRGWSCTELDDLATQDGKNALHMAAWQGPLENVVYLVETVGCKLDAIATGEFSYGKTPIFFAATRCRAEIVEYLLDAGSFVRIVNNKGQSVRSIVASHDLGETIMQKIIQSEKVASEDWWNFRATHSDGLEYGDLDPRFLERDLRDTDVVTLHAVNPTTKQSRKGSFYRKNPHLASNKNGGSSEEPKQQHKKKNTQPDPPLLTTQETEQEEQAWYRIRVYLSATEEEHENPELGQAKVRLNEDLVTIVQLKDKLRQPWIPEVALQLQDVSQNEAIARQLVRDACEGATTATKRDTKLLRKLLVQMEDPESYRQTVQPQIPKTASSDASATPTVPLALWQRASLLIPDAICFDQTLNTNDETLELRLREAPTWIDSMEGMTAVKSILLKEVEQRGDLAVAFDTEWCDGINNTTYLGTLQLAIVTDDRSSLQSWVINMADNKINEEDYQPALVDLVQFLFSDRLVLLGFSVLHNDVPKIQDYVGSSVSLSTNNLLDLQQAVAANKAQLPGLASTVAKYGSILSKLEQCSDWAARPLSSSQLEYAGLDAAVLLVLLAEMKRSQNDNVRSYE